MSTLSYLLNQRCWNITNQSEPKQFRRYVAKWRKHLSQPFFYLCETNKDCLSSQNLFVNRPLVGKSSYTLAVALLNNLRSEIRIDGAIALSYPPYCYWWLIMKKRGWKLYRSPNPNPRGVRKCNSAELTSWYQLLNK